MRKMTLREMIFLAVACDIGMAAKKIIAPLANLITDNLHIPGGIGTGFSLMFILIALLIYPRFGNATLMSIVQSGVAFCIGSIGSMGALAPIGYIVPGLVMDMTNTFLRKLGASENAIALASSVLASVTAAITANIIVFRLWGLILLLYLSVAALSGAVFSFIAVNLAERLRNTKMVAYHD